jgi:hypothetical protein
VAGAFVATRLAGQGGIHGEQVLDDGAAGAIVARAWPGIC